MNNNVEAKTCGTFVGAPVISVPEGDVIVLTYSHNGNTTVDFIYKTYQDIKEAFTDNDVICIPDYVAISTMKYDSALKMLKSVEEIIRCLIKSKKEAAPIEGQMDVSDFIHEACEV